MTANGRERYVSASEPRSQKSAILSLARFRRTSGLGPSGRCEPSARASGREGPLMPSADAGKICFDDREADEAAARMFSSAAGSLPGSGHSMQWTGLGEDFHRVGPGPQVSLVRCKSMNISWLSLKITWFPGILSSVGPGLELGHRDARHRARLTSPKAYNPSMFDRCLTR